MKISEKDIGRRVVVNGEIDGQTFVKETGVLKYGGDDFCRPGVKSVTVEFDNPREVFHDCSEKTADKHGFWVPESMITFIEDNKMDMDFQVGDPVQCVLYGDGVIIKSINSDKDDAFPIEVFFNDEGCSEFYTLQGQYYGDSARSLYHAGSIKREGQKIIIDPVKPVRDRWVNVYIDSDGKPFFGPLGNQYTTQEAAKENIVSHWGYVTSIQLKRSKP